MHIADVRINVQMVGIHRCDYSSFREKLEERTVEFISFGHYSVVFTDKKVRVMVLRYSSKECRASFAAVLENVGQKRTGGRLSVCSGHGQTSLTLSDLSQST